MTSSKKTIVWFRKDLRVSDNPALTCAIEAGLLLPIYILDQTDPYESSGQTARNVWLYHSLKSLNEKLGGHLKIFKGNPIVVLSDLVAQYDIDAIYWNRCYTPHRIKDDTKIKEKFSAKAIVWKSFNGSLLWEPWQIAKPDGTPYKVFTPFYKKGCLKGPRPRAPLAPSEVNNFVPNIDAGTAIEELGLLPQRSWGGEVINNWMPGEDGARLAWSNFIGQGLADYKRGRDFPARPNVSRLSPHLAFGEISPHQIWRLWIIKWMTIIARISDRSLHGVNFLTTCSIIFRISPQQCFNQKFDRFSWGEDPGKLKAWQLGQTGIPIVDAGMRELWQTGYMHNRVRMIVASFLTKNLNIDWRLGAEWFEHCLFDADLANNRASWQWVAGCGADAAPYFRVFNPVLQAQKFDNEGTYIRKYVPELAELPDKFIACPFDAPEEISATADVQLGQDYPLPIVDLKQSRAHALMHYRQQMQ